MALESATVVLLDCSPFIPLELAVKSLSFALQNKTIRFDEFSTESLILYEIHTAYKCFHIRDGRRGRFHTAVARKR